MTASSTRVLGDRISDRPLFQVRRVTKSYSGRNFVALENIDLDLPRGSFASIIGSSGCGKSTLLKIMAGLTPPTSGSVMLAGKPVMGPRVETGMMFQQATLFPWLTAIENVLLPIGIKSGKAAAEQARQRALDLLSLVGLSGFDNAYPSELSGGMAQRTAMCRMLITDPEMLLLDEPFSALDELTRDFMNMELQRICMSRQATTLLVTHSISEAVILSDTVYVMAARPGRIVKRLEIDLPRPRTLDMMTQPEFGAYVSEIRNHLDKGAFL